MISDGDVIFLMVIDLVVGMLEILYGFGVVIGCDGGEELLIFYL